MGPLLQTVTHAGGGDTEEDVGMESEEGERGKSSGAANRLRVVSVLACNAVKSVIIVQSASSITKRTAEQGAN